MDLATLSDEDLDAHRVAVLSEIERRDRAASIPAQVESLARQYLADGHDPATLSERVAEAAATPDQPSSPAGGIDVEPGSPIDTGSPL